MKRISLVLFVIIQSLTFNIIHGDCPASVVGEEGFNLCVFDRSNNLVSSALSLTVNTLWEVQTALCVAQCYCRQDCEPPQIVCDNTALYNETSRKIVQPFLFKDPRQTIANFVSNVIYTGINWRLHCFCPKEVKEGDDQCPIVDNPKLCSVPNRSPPPALSVCKEV